MEIRSCTPQDIEHLLTIEAPVYVSLYLQMDTATVVAGKARATKLLRAAEAGLASHDIRSPEADALLAPLSRAFDEPGFWRGRRGSIALFCTPTEWYGYQLPLDAPEAVYVGSEFFIKPLLPLLTWERPFYVLAVSQNRARLMECAHDRVRSMDVEGMPLSLEDALRNEESEKQQQLYSAPRSVGGGGAGGAVRFGMGGAPEEHKSRLERYLRMIDAAVHRALVGTHAPLVFAGVEYLFPMYQQLTAYPHLYQIPLKGNPDRLRAETLHARARELLSGYFEEEKCRALAQFRELHGAGRTFTDLESIINAAHDGRIQTLLLDRAAEQWGEYNPATRQVLFRPHPEADGNELANLAAILTLRGKGKAFALDTTEMPVQAGMAAVLRY